MRGSRTGPRGTVANLAAVQAGRLAFRTLRADVASDDLQLQPEAVAEKNGE